LDLLFIVFGLNRQHTKMENIPSNKSTSEQQRQRWRINAANRRRRMTPQERLIEKSKRRKNNPENTINIVQMPNRALRLRMTSIRQMAQSVTDAGNITFLLIIIVCH